MSFHQLSQENTFEFLTNVLHISDSAKSLLNENRLGFLNQIIVAWQKYLPYQNISQLKLTKYEQRLPSAQEIIDQQMRGQGGVCLYHAYFAYLVSRSLGFDAQLIPSDVQETFDHLIVLVKNLNEQGDEYLMEVGCGYPALEAIPVHELTPNSPSKIYNQAGLEFMYVRRDLKILRYHRTGDDPNRRIANRNFIPGGWRRYYECNIDAPFDPQKLFTTVTGISKCLTSKNDSYWFLRQVRSVVVSDNAIIAIKHNQLILQNETEGRRAIFLTDRQQVLEAFVKYFPMLSSTDVSEALDYIAENTDSV